MRDSLLKEKESFVADAESIERELGREKAWIHLSKSIGEARRHVTCQLRGCMGVRDTRHFIGSTLEHVLPPGIPSYMDCI